MASVNVTVRVDEDVKKEFDIFCDNVGMNITTAFNMFMRATLRTRQLPFQVMDIAPTPAQARIAFADAFRAVQEDAIQNGTDSMSIEEIDALIADTRQEKRG